MAALHFALYMEELVLHYELDLDEQEDVPDRGEAEHVEGHDEDAEEEEGEEGEEEDVEEEIPQFIRPLRPDEHFNLDAYNDDWLKKQFRFYRQDIEAIFIALQMPDMLRTQAGDRVTGVEALNLQLVKRLFIMAERSITHSIIKELLEQMASYFISVQLLMGQ
ncbi:hypothetical protein BG000_005636 [Podila horticola]|nr:hypothetical protein BG000_005636 [Podila horticola]